jgi:hypothetical protein
VATPGPSKNLRILKQSEVTTAIGVAAKKILNENFSKPYGTEVPFESNGKKYVGRLEEHYHPPGGKAKPWGKHKGVTVYAVVEEKNGIVNLLPSG